MPNFPDGEKQKFFLILPEKNTGFYMTNKQKPYFFRKFQEGGGETDLMDEGSLPLSYGKNPDHTPH